MSSREAAAIADSKELDLVLISPTAKPPVCKIMDYGKYKYEMIKREKENKKNQKVVEIKEVRLSATIDTGDMVTKSKQALKFLGEESFMFERRVFSCSECPDPLPRESLFSS